jgi:ribosome biogenesis GTPase
MPRGEQSRRAAVLAAALSTLADQQPATTASQPDPVETGLRGTVIEVASSQVRVDVDGQTLRCGLRGSLGAEETGETNVVAVGDHVLVTPDGYGGGAVVRVLPRRSVLARPSTFHTHLKQVIAANVDQLLVVASWCEPTIWLELIDRYLIAAERNNLPALICINKTDLTEDASECHSAAKPYEDIGCRVILTSATRGTGIDELRSVLREKTTVLAGLSGVGKSSLLNAVQPGLQLRTSDVSDFDSAGRHTTTQVRMLRLEMGGYVVDTPGVRDIGLVGLRRRDLAAFYPEFAALARRCRFADCTHAREPGCAVREAVRAGELPRSRFETYGKILKDLRE